MVKDIETFELASAAASWGYLRPEQQDDLRCAYNHDGYFRAKFRREHRTTKEPPPIDRGYTLYDYNEIPEGNEIADSLVELGLLKHVLRAEEGNWGSNGPPHYVAYALTPFGKIVARYGDAVSIVNAAKAATATFA